MAVSTEDERLEIIRKALGYIESEELIAALEGKVPDASSGYNLVEVFSALPLHGQFLALGRANITLGQVGYGHPSEGTIAVFGPDGQMKLPLKQRVENTMLTIREKLHI